MIRDLYVLKAEKDIPARSVDPTGHVAPGGGACLVFEQDGNVWKATDRKVPVFNFAAVPVLADGSFIFGATASESIHESGAIVLLNL